MSNARNSTFDIFKGIACIMIVFTHCAFPGTFGVSVQTLARWTVPFFFVVSGYFFRKYTIEACMRKAKHIACITAWAVALYIPVALIENLVQGGLIEYIQEEFTLFNIASFVIFNSPVFIAGQMWFLFALIYVYLSVAIAIKLDLMQYKKIVAVILLVAHFAIGYGLFLIGHPIKAGAYRNFLFEGIPFFLIGNILYEKKWETRKYGIPIALIGIGGVLSVMEYMLLGRPFSIHISSLILLAGILWLCSCDALQGKFKYLCAFGKKYSLYIYVLHPAVITVFDLCFEALGIQDALLVTWLRPLNTLLWTSLLAVVICRIAEERGRRKNGRYISENC